MKKLTTRLTLGLMAVVSMLVGLASTAYAVDPTPPADPSTAAGSGIANFGDAAIDVFASLVTNVWVLALFAAGIALAFAARVIQGARSKFSRPLAK